MESSWFVDVFTREFNRDIAPMKGGYTDNYYYQLIANVRKFKGMEKPPVYSEPENIGIDGEYDDWQEVKPVFYDAPGDVMPRDFKGYDTTVVYTNKTGRNDIVESRVTQDQKIPLEAIGSTRFDFHWADNPQHLRDISAFFLDGDSAPDRRFNYRYQR